MSYRPTYEVRPDMDPATATKVQSLNAHAIAHASELDDIIAHCKRLHTSAALYNRWC